MTYLLSPLLIYTMATTKPYFFYCMFINSLACTFLESAKQTSNKWIKLTKWVCLTKCSDSHPWNSTKLPVSCKECTFKKQTNECNHTWHLKHLDDRNTSRLMFWKGLLVKCIQIYEHLYKAQVWRKAALICWCFCIDSWYTSHEMHDASVKQQSHLVVKLFRCVQPRFQFL